MSRRWAALSDLAFLGLLVAVLVLSAGGHLVVGDEETMFRVTQNLLAGQGVAVGRETLVVPAESYPLFLPHAAESLPTTSAVPGRHGQLYSKYGMGQSLLAIPLYLLGILLARLSPVVSDAQGARLAASMLNPLALAGCGWLVMRLGLALGYRLSTARWIALAALFASIAWPYVKTFYPQPTMTFLVLAAVYAAYRWRQAAQQRWLWVLGLATAAIILFRISGVIIIPVLGLYLVLARSANGRGRAIMSLGIGVAVGLGLSGAYNWQRFGSLFSTGYHEIAWTTPFPLGLYGLLFSPGKGILVYTPMLILGLGAWAVFFRRHRAEAWLMAGLWLAWLAFYAPYNFWTGGFNWGPRFLLPVLPFGFLPLGALLEESQSRLVTALFAILFAVGLLIQTSAILVDHSRYLYQVLADANQTRAYDKTVFQTDYSPLWQQWPVAVELIRAYTRPETWQAATNSLQALATSPAASDVPNGRDLLTAEFMRRNTPNFWWLHARLLDPARPGPLVLVAPWMILALASGWLLWYADRRLKHVWPQSRG